MGGASGDFVIRASVMWRSGGGTGGMFGAAGRCVSLL